MQRIRGAYGDLAVLVRLGWKAPTRHLMTGIFVALPVSVLVLIFLVLVLPFGVGLATAAMAVVQLVVSLAVAGWQSNRRYRS